jgi:hypothetical protein
MSPRHGTLGNIPHKEKQVVQWMDKTWWMEAISSSQKEMKRMRVDTTLFGRLIALRI